jgi:hypothetical protein
VAREIVSPLKMQEGDHNSYKNTEIAIDISYILEFY